MKLIKKYRVQFLDSLTHTSVVKYIFKLRNKDTFMYTHEQLHQFPSGTLGKELANELSKNNFTLLKNYERHDCKHIILGFPMNELGEASMQFFLFGTRYYSFPQIIALGVCTVIMPEYWSAFYKEYKRGRRCPKLTGVDYNELVHQPVEKLIATYQNK